MILSKKIRLWVFNAHSEIFGLSAILAFDAIKLRVLIYDSP